MKIFWPIEPEAAVVLRHRARAHRGEIGARLRLGQVHGAGPFAGHHLREEALLLLGRADKLDRLDRALRQQRAQIEGHVRRVPHLLHRGGHELRQTLSAEIGILGEAVPAVGAILPVGLLEARRRAHRAVLEPARALAVADGIERIEHFGGELRGLLENRRRPYPASRPRSPAASRPARARPARSDELHLLQWCMVLAHRCRFLSRVRRSIAE